MYEWGWEGWGQHISKSSLCWAFRGVDLANYSFSVKVSVLLSERGHETRDQTLDVHILKHN